MTTEDKEPKQSKESTDDSKIISQIEAEDAKQDLDNQIDQQTPPQEPMVVKAQEKHKWLAKIKKPKFWLGLFASLIIVLILLWLILPTRIWLLNILGFKADLNINVQVSTASTEPSFLKNANVKINNQDYKTNDDGTVQAKVNYGQTTVEVSKPGYQTESNSFMIDYDPFFHLLGGSQADKDALNQTFKLKNVGLSFTFNVTDWLTGQPITKGNFSIGDVVATANSDGKVLITIPATDDVTVQMVIKPDPNNYADKVVDVPTNQLEQNIVLVPAGKHFFMSNQSGAPGFYSSNLDGTEIKEVVAPSTSETGDVAYSVKPDQTKLVLATARDATRDGFGSLQQKLYTINPTTKQAKVADTALKFTLLDWYKDNLIYIATEHNSAGQTVQRLAVLAADSNTAKALYNTNSTFGYARVAGDSVIFTPAQGDLRIIKADGSKSEKSLGSGIKAVAQTEPLRFAYQAADQSWRQYDVNSDQVSVSSAPISLNKAFLANSSKDGQNLLEVDTIDGKPTLLSKNVSDGKDAKLYTGANFSAPIYWVGNVAVYRAGSADFAISANGQYPAKKITDVLTSPPNSLGYFVFN